jgi:hypothetical protein
MVEADPGGANKTAFAVLGMLFNFLPVQTPDFTASKINCFVSSDITNLHILVSFLASLRLVNPLEYIDRRNRFEILQLYCI